MPRIDELDVPFIDTLGSAYHADFHRFHAEALQQSWVASTPLGPLVLSDRHVRALLRDHRLDTVTMQWTLEAQGVGDGPFWQRTTRTLLALDGDDHLRLRRLAMPFFTPEAVDRLRPFMRRTMTTLLDAVFGDRCDAVAALARPYASAVLCELVGAPDRDSEQIAAWAADVLSVFEFQLEKDRRRIEDAQAGIDAYVRALLHHRGSTPGDDLVTALIAHSQQHGTLSEDEVAMIITDVLVGGIDTTRHQLALAL